MTTAARLYADQYDAVWEQWQRLFGPQPDDVWAGPAAAQFRFDPRRELDANLAALASCVEPGDVLVDVGGGAGRVSLPLALRCQEVVTVEPSPAMAAEYAGLVQEAGITNARLLAGDWMEADGVAGDVVVTCDVTYFVRDIVPFVRRMEAAARRRVMITVWSEPPPNRGADLFRRVYGEPQVPMCGHRQLLPVLCGRWASCPKSVCFPTRHCGRRGISQREMKPLSRSSSAAGLGRPTESGRERSSKSSSTKSSAPTAKATGPNGAPPCVNC